MTTPPVDARQIREAADALHAIVPPTPLVESPTLSRRVGAPVYLKCEQWQPMGAFKLRGAYTALSRLAPEAQARGIITHSSGNHGQAVAWVAQRLGLKATVVMPETAPAVKVEGVRHYGAEIIFTPAISSARLQKAAELAAEAGLTLVAPYDDPHIILGQATCAWEILTARPEISTFLVPIGGGGLLAGTATTIQAMSSDAAAIGCEPTGAAKLSAALAAGRPVALERTQSIADGLLPLSVGQLTFACMQPVVRQAAQVSDEEIAAAVRLLYYECGLRVEPSGAVGVAALVAGRVTPPGPTAIMLSGGNVDPALFQRLIA